MKTTAHCHADGGMRSRVSSEDIEQPVGGPMVAAFVHSTARAGVLATVTPHVGHYDKDERVAMRRNVGHHSA